MALQKSTEALGITFDTAYHAITHYTSSKITPEGKYKVLFQIEAFTDNTKVHKIPDVSTSYVREVDTYAETLYDQCYAYAKTQPEFEGAIDI